MVVKRGNDEGVFEKKIRDLEIPVYKGLTATLHRGRKRIESVNLGPQFPEVIH
ncbi:MAG: hypothetical protein CM1200mP30_00410 [Pseudomonadota bacterium]|nr:MAG: hypothetical protein CM1200mP30_00410 [Pseudomonadota bacterium]